MQQKRLLRQFCTLGRTISYVHTLSRWSVVSRIPGVLSQAYRVRFYATPPPFLNVSSLSTEEYHALSDVTMECLLERLEGMVDNLARDDYEVDYSAGVLTLKLGAAGTYVINKQPPNKQIWLSSPFSGPKRYDYNREQKIWYYTRNGERLDELLSKELSRALGSNIEIRFE